MDRRIIDFDHVQFHRLAAFFSLREATKGFLDSIASLFFGSQPSLSLVFAFNAATSFVEDKGARSLDNITGGIRGRQNDGVARQPDELFCSQNNQSSRPVSAQLVFLFLPNCTGPLALFYVPDAISAIRVLSEMQSWTGRLLFLTKYRHLPCSSCFLRDIFARFMEMKLYGEYFH